MSASTNLEVLTTNIWQLAMHGHWSALLEKAIIQCHGRFLAPTKVYMRRYGLIVTAI